MKKLIKISLLAGLLSLSMLSVSAATFTDITATTSLNSMTITLELPVGTYPTGKSELLAREGITCPIKGDPGNYGNQANVPFVVLGTFELSANDVATLRTSKINKPVTASFDLGCSEIKVMTGTNNAPQPSTGGNTNPGGGNSSNFDLSYYSNGRFNIYESSRVVHASHSGNTLYMKGYAFEAFRNYAKADAFVREVIFLDKNDPSNPSKAYRLALPAVRDPYLNNNAYLNPNRSYNYNYAYYGGNLNLSKVREYTKPENSTRVNLPRGEYYVYIRLSDGVGSNLMSLKSTKAEVILPTTFRIAEGNEIIFTR